MKRIIVACSAASLAIAAACSSYDSNDANASDAGAPDVANMVADATMSSDAGDAGSSSRDADASSPSLDAGLCDNTMPFIGFQSLGSTVNSGNLNDRAPHLTDDELTMYVGRNNAQSFFLVRFRRDAKDQAWGPAEPLLGNTVFHLSMWASPGGGVVYYDELNGSGSSTAFRIHRRTVDGDGKFGPETTVPGLYEGLNHSVDPFLPADESEIWFASNRNGGQYDIFRAVASGGAFGTNEAIVNTGADERTPVLSADRKTLYFASGSGRATANTTGIKMITRSSPSDLFTAPADVVGLEALSNDAKGFSAGPGWISPDNCRLYLHSTLDGSLDVFVAWRR